MKFGVGIMLTGFGVFWSRRRRRGRWPGGEAAIVGVLVFVAALALAMTAVFRAAARGDVDADRNGALKDARNPTVLVLLVRLLLR